MSKPKKKPVAVKATETQINQMFQFWYEHNRDYSATSRKFKVAVTTVRRYADRFKWADRYADIKAKVQAGVDAKLVREEISNVKIAKSLLGKELKVYQEEKKATGNIYAILHILKYIDGVIDGDKDRDPAGGVVNHFHDSVTFNQGDQQGHDSSIARILSGDRFKDN